MLPPSNVAKSGPVVGNVPAVTGTFLCAAREPARASTATIGMNRPSAMQTPSDDWNQSFVTVIPANAEPLLFDADAYA